MDRLVTGVPVRLGVGGGLTLRLGVGLVGLTCMRSVARRRSEERQRDLIGAWLNAPTEACPLAALSVVATSAKGDRE